MALPRTLIEVCVDDVEGALAAARAGADRLELAGSLREGGISPSLGLVRRVRALVSIPIFVLLRPRGGDFHYTSDELAVLAHDLEATRDAGADGSAMGAPRRDGHLDVAALERLVALSGGRPLTCHRAFDFTPNLEKSLETLVGLGFSRILTSGGAARAPEGVPMLHHLVQFSRGRIGILPGGGISPTNVHQLVTSTGVTEVHLSATDWRPFDHPVPPGLSVEGAPPPPGSWTKLTSASHLAQVRAALSPSP